MIFQRAARKYVKILKYDKKLKRLFLRFLFTYFNKKQEKFWTKNPENFKNVFNFFEIFTN